MNDNYTWLAISAIAVLIVTCCAGLWLAFRDPEKRKNSDYDADDVVDALDLLDQAIDFDD